MKRIIAVGMTAMAVAGVFGLITSPAFADVHVSQNGATLTVTAPSTLAGKGLVLQTDAESSGTWTTKANIVGAVPAAGGSYTVDLAALGIANGTPCRIASATIYNRLDMLQMTSTQTYVDTGIKGHDVYGLRFGFYPTGKSGTGKTDLYSAINCGKDNSTGTVANRGGFSVCVANNKELHRFRFLWRGRNYDKGDNLVDTTAINEYAFTNRVCTLNGVVRQSDLATGAISTNEHNVFIGKCSYTTYSLYGWWSHVSFDDVSGNKILDYIPVQRGDGTVGFWNSVGDGAFVTSSGTGSFSAGAPTGESFITDVESLLAFTANRQLACSSEAGVVTISVPSGIAGERIIIAWDEADKGDDLADWAHSATLTDSATAGTITQNLSRLGIRNGTYVRIFAANVYKPLDMLWIDTAQKYVDTGILGTDIYGLRFGFYPTGRSTAKTGDLYYCIGCGKDNASNITGAYGTVRGSFAWGIAEGKDIGHVRFFWRGVNNDISESTVLASKETINESAFTNRVFTLNGDLITSNLAAGSISTNLYPVSIGKNAYTTDNNFRLYGWWSHVSFDDASGNRILDYIPVQRVSDGKVGFYDRATLTFVTSSGTGDFTAGTVTNDTPVVAVNASSAAWEVTDIQGLIIIFK